MKSLMIALGMLALGVVVYVGWRMFVGRTTSTGSRFPTQRFQSGTYPQVDELDRQRSEENDRGIMGGAFPTEEGKVHVGTPPAPSVPR